MRHLLGSSWALGNLTEVGASWQCCPRMAKGRPKSAKSPRPERIRVPNREPALLTVDGHNFVGILQRLSLSGGSVIHTEQPFPRGTLAGLALKTVFGKVTAQIEILHTGADGIAAAQAFRFLGMDKASTSRLRAAINKMRVAGFSDAEMEQKTLATFVSQGLNTLRDHMERLPILAVSRKKVREKT